MADEGVAQEHRDSDCDRLLGEVSWDDYVTCHHSEGDTAASIEHCGICSGCERCTLTCRAEDNQTYSSRSDEH